MMKNKNQMKIKRVLYDDAYNFEKLSGFIKVFKNGVIEIDDSGLVSALERAIKDQDENKRLHIKIKKLEDKIKLQSDKLQVLQDESDELDELRVDIDRLQDEKTQLQQELKKNVELKQELEGQLRKSKNEITQLSDQVQQDRDIKEIFCTYGRFLSLQKDLELLLFFMKNKDRSIRQIEVIDTFKHRMQQSTVIKHLTGLKERGLLVTGDFRGELRINPSKFSDVERDMDKLCRAVIGDEVFDLAVKHNQKT